MAAENMDRRVRKTRTMLRLCLARLLKEKKIQEISVKEISEMADINRGTFYLHYRDVYDLLASIEDDMFRQFNGILERNTPSGEITERPSRLILELFSFIRENADLAQILMGPNGDIQFLNHGSPKACISGTKRTTSTGTLSSPTAAWASSRPGLKTGPISPLRR